MVALQALSRGKTPIAGNVRPSFMASPKPKAKQGKDLLDAEGSAGQKVAGSPAGVSGTRSPTSADLPFELAKSSPLQHYFRGESGPNLRIIVKILQDMQVNRATLAFEHPRGGRWRLPAAVAPEPPGGFVPSPDIQQENVGAVVNGFEKEFRVRVGGGDGGRGAQPRQLVCICSIPCFVCACGAQKELWLRKLSLLTLICIAIAVSSLSRCLMIR